MYRVIEDIIIEDIIEKVYRAKREGMQASRNINTLENEKYTRRTWQRLKVLARERGAGEHRTTGDWWRQLFW